MMNCLIRADASPQMGTGHIMRCLALAQGLRQAGGSVWFVVGQITPALEQRLQAEGFGFDRVTALIGSAEDARQTILLAQKNRVSWLILDGYHFGGDYQFSIKQAGLLLLAMDDYGHAARYYADLVLNQNLGAEANLYARRESYTKLLLGTRYVLLRREFLAWKGWRREIPPLARKILITLGGSDPSNFTGKAVDALARLCDGEVKIVVGGSNLHLEPLRNAIQRLGPNFHLEVDAKEMPELMAWADVALCAGGTTAWELLFMGLPCVTVILADNQASVALALEKSGLSVGLGLHDRINAQSLASELAALQLNAALRKKMSEAGRKSVDGRGTDRVVSRLFSFGIELRRAQESDCRQIWLWANDPEVRAVSFASEPIPWEHHVRWYNLRLLDQNCFFYIAEIDGTPMGQIRFQRNGTEGVVSISLAPGMRGKGLGALLMVKGTGRFLEDAGAQLVHAYMKPDNRSSIRAFAKADYEDAGMTMVENNLSCHYIFAE